MKNFFKNKEGKTNIFKVLFFATYGILLIAMPIMSLNVGVNGDARFHLPQSQHIIDFYLSGGKDNTVNTSAYDLKASDEYKALEKKKLQENFGVTNEKQLNPQQAQAWRKMHYKAFSDIYLLREYDFDTFIPGRVPQDYGSFYEFFAGIYYKVMGFEDIWDMRFFNFRKVLIAVFGLIILLFTGLLAQAIGGWRAGFFALIMMALWPRVLGHMFFNIKDVPFAAGYAMGLYFTIRFLQDLPKPNWKILLGAILGIAIAFNMRAAGGILLIAYFILFLGLAYVYANYINNKVKRSVKDYLPIALRGVIVIVGAYFVGLLFWPHGLMDPISHPFETYQRQAAFPTTIGVLFEGQRIGSTEVPSNYATKWIAITTPLYILLGLLIGAILLFVKRKASNTKYLFLVAFTLAFPVFWVIYKKSNLYDGWRHLYFVSVPMIVVGSVGYHWLINTLNNKVLQYVIASFIGLSAISGLKYIVENHPHEYVYFNDISGGMEEAYGQFETDYYMLSAREAVEWLIENKKLESTQEEIKIVSDMIYPVKVFVKSQLPENIKPSYCSYYSRVNRDYDYGIFYSRFIDPREFKARSWPPRGETIHTIEVNGKPIACIVQKVKR